QKLGFHDKELALYEGTVELKADLAAAPEKAVTLNLRVQACSDKICLEPETAQLRVPVHEKPAG
ncbi:MAG: protein-disulfide reductase DsbD domain-containing protein, partial [Pseudomonadota bacterium]